MTKPLCTAPLLAIGRKRGELDWSDRAERWLPEWNASPYKDLSLADLALHRGGLPAWVPLGGLESLADPPAGEPFAPEARAPRLQAALEGIAGLAPAVARGETLYSDLGYIALGAVLERAAGQPLERLFDERIAEPLRLRSAGFAGPRRDFAAAAATEAGNRFERELAGDAGAHIAFRREVPRGEVHDGNAYLLGGVAGHAGLFGAIDDVARIAEALLDEDSAIELAAEDRERMLRPAGGGRTYGFECASVCRAVRGILPDDAPGHLGFTGTSVWFDLACGGVAVLLTNRVHPEIGDRDFQWLRRGFHRLAVRRWRRAD